MTWDQFVQGATLFWNTAPWWAQTLIVLFYISLVLKVFSRVLSIIDQLTD